MTPAQQSLTLIANSLDDQSLNQIERALSKLEVGIVSKKILAWSSFGVHQELVVEEENRLDLNCVELIIETAVDREALRQSLSELLIPLSIEFVLQNQDQHKHNRKLACFDMDSTLIKAEVIDQLAIRAGVGTQVAEITSRAMHGDIDFRTSFKQRMRLLEGLSESVLQDVAENLPLMEGVEILFKNLKSRGITTVILSGGFTYFAEFLQEKLSIDHVYANHLEIFRGKLTGNVVEPIIDANMKERLLHQISQELDLSISQSVAVGDGANDLLMLQAAGLGVAYHAKPLVQEQAPSAISKLPLSALLFVLGFNNDQIVV